MRVFGFEITRAKAAVSPMSMDDWTRGWGSLVRESFAGAWQRGITVDNNVVLKQSTVWSCLTLISSDIGKLAVSVIEKTKDGIWEAVENSAYSPVLRKPNRYQTRIKFFEQWMLSKLSQGNTYALKERDGSRKVRALYILDPTRVRPLVAPDGSVYYELGAEPLAGIPGGGIRVPASEIIHDVAVALYHPLCGLPPLTACALAATQSLKIQEQSAKFFQNNSKPGGVLTAPGAISNDTAERIQKHWDENYAGEQNAGRVAVLGDGLKYEAMSVTSTDAQLVEQLDWSDQRICSTFHMPAFLVGVGPMPAVNVAEQLMLQYYSQCLQHHIESIELCLDEGLELDSKTGVEFDIDNLIRMDSKTKMDTATAGVKGAIFTPNYARKKYYNLPPMTGGDALYLQQQNYSLEALAKRDAKEDPFSGGGFGGDVFGDHQEGLSAIEQAKARADAYGVAVRAGAVTPQKADEADFRGELGLPEMSDDVASAWAEDDGVRHPITLRDPNAKTQSPFTPAPEDNDKAMMLRFRASLATQVAALAVEHAEMEPQRAA